ncbi:MAG: hypothetical protein JO224_12230 [Pelomonas sp.]|nr:hypothetical protein [Roseateles sp.]
MSKTTMERWVWILVYGGLLAVSLGLFMRREPQGVEVAGWLLAGGGVAAAAGVLLIWLRARRG